MTIAVTADSGQLGSEIVRALERLDTGLSIIGLARTPDHEDGLDIEVRPGDYADTQQLSASLQGAEENTAFSPVVQSNRQTKADLRASGLGWAIGRNGIYIEPDVESIGDYEAAGEIAHCAGDAIAGIYEGIRNGAHDTPSDFSAAAGKHHQGWDDYFAGCAAT